MPADPVFATAATTPFAPGLVSLDRRWPVDPGLPKRIGKYRVIRRLGEGATSEVFLAEDEFGQRQVAIKRVREANVGDRLDQHHRERFFAAEADLAGKLQHPNVVRIFDAVADPHQPYLVMEYVPGDTLQRHCRPDALLPLDQIVEIGFKCAMALGYVARHGLIHRDVKPANILATVRPEGVRRNERRFSFPETHPPKHDRRRFA